MAHNTSKLGPKFSSDPCFWCGKNIRYGKTIQPYWSDLLKAMFSFGKPWVYCSERCRKAHSKDRK